MSWFRNRFFVNHQAEALKEEVNRLQFKITEQLNRHDESRAAFEAALRDQELARTEDELTLSKERQKNTSATSELNRRIQQLETSLALDQQKLRQLEQTVASLNDLVRFRDQQIEETQTTNAYELQVRESKVQHLEQKLRDLEAKMTSDANASIDQIAILARQLAGANARHAEESKDAAAKIRELEQQLSASESRSESRAEQRSALLRNLAEINRLSSFVTKNDPVTGSFKLIQADSNGSDIDQDQNAMNELLPQIATWNVYGDVESA